VSMTLDLVTTRVSARLRPYLWTLGVLWLLPALLVGVLWLVLPKELPPGQCEGLGFGCTLSPADSVLVFAVMAGPLVVTLGVAGVCVVAAVQTLRAHRPQPPVATDTRTPR